jgi:valyl-tRNA synthetase
MNLEGVPCQGVETAALLPEDRWILARLNRAVVEVHRALDQYRYSAAVKVLREFFWDALCDWYIELTKPRMTGGPMGPEAKQVLAFCLDQTLRLLHPFLPFITERLWLQLNEVAPRRGLPGVAEPAGSEALIVAEFPPADGWPGLHEPAVLDLFADIQSITRGVREMRNSHKVSPKQAVKVTVKAPADHIESLAAHVHIVRELGNVADLRVVAHAERPPDSASAVIGGLQIYVHDIGDDEAERRKLHKELAEVEKAIAGKRKKLDNANFVNNANPEIVQAERDRLAELQTRKQGLEAGLSELGA